MDAEFRDWAAQSLSFASLNSYLSGLRSIEAAYGDLDLAYAADRFSSIYKDLTYSSSDDRAGRPNPTRIPINRNLGKQLSNLRSHLRFYESFKDLVGIGAAETATTDIPETLVPSEQAETPVLSLERDLERALRAEITQLDSSLTVIDGGVQVSVPSGRIDILAQDASGCRVVIELKAFRAPRDAVAQVLAYMGDLAAEGGFDVRGLLIAPDFDPRAIAAARMAPALRLIRFSFSFQFDKVGTGR